MVVYHVCKSRYAAAAIATQGRLRPCVESNISLDETGGYVYVSTKPINVYAADVFGPDTNMAAFLTLDVPDDVQWEPDPTDQAEVDLYSTEPGARWLRAKGDVPAKVITTKVVRNVQQAMFKEMA